MGVNEGTLADNQVRCTENCDIIIERHEAKRCAFCPDAILCDNCWGEHTETEFAGVIERPGATYPDFAYRVLNHPELPRIIVREPHYEGGGGDDGSGSCYCDEGWVWEAEAGWHEESGAPLTAAQKGEVEDWMKDDITDRLAY